MSAYNIRYWVSRKKITIRIDTNYMASERPGPVLVEVFDSEKPGLRAASSGEFEEKTSNSVPRVYTLKVSMEGNFDPGIYKVLIRQRGTGQHAEGREHRFQID